MTSKTEQIMQEIEVLKDKIDLLESELEKEHEKTYQDCLKYMEDKIGKSYDLGAEIVKILSVELRNNVIFVNCYSLEIDNRHDGRIYIYCDKLENRICGDFYKGGVLETLKQTFNPKTEINLEYFNQIVSHVLYIRDVMNLIKTQEN